MSDDDTLAPVAPWNYAVMSIDILGQNCIYDGIPDLITSGDSLDGAGKALKRSFGAVRLVRSLIHGSFAYYLRESTSDPENPTNRYMPEGIRVFSFADTVVSSLCLKSSSSAAASLLSMLAVHATTMVSALGAEVALRGGMALGWAAPLRADRDEIYGPALNRAHYLESQVAQRPRVVIDRRIVNYLRALMEHGAPGSDERSVLRTVASWALAYITEDTDNVPCLDFLCEMSSHTSRRGLPLGKFAEMCEIVSAGRRFVADQAQYWRDQGCAKLSGRYEATERYFASRLDHWRPEEVIGSQNQG